METKPLFTNWEEHVNPCKIVVTLLNGKKIVIKPKHNYREKVYQEILYAFNNNKIVFLNNLIVEMQNRLN